MNLLRKHTYSLTGSDPDFRDIFTDGTLDPYKWTFYLKFKSLLIEEDFKIFKGSLPLKSEYIYFEMKLNLIEAAKVKKIIKASNKKYPGYNPRKLKYCRW